MNKKRFLYFNIFLFTLLICFCSCEVPYDNNARLLIKGLIIDENNQPISGAEIKTYVVVETFFGSVDENIGATLSQGDGRFEIISLLGRDEDFVIDVLVNQNYTKYQYRTNLTDFTPTDYLIDLGQVPIRKKISFDLNVERVSPEGTELEYTLEYIIPDCREVYFEEVLNEEESFCYRLNSYSGTLNDSNPNLSLNFISVLNSEVRFSYSINGQPQINQQLIIDDFENELSFEY